MPVSYSGTAITWPDNSTTTSGWTGFKNRIINGNMAISQRGTSFTPATASIYTLDRWSVFQNTAGRAYTVEQSSTAPTGFINSALVTTTTGAAAGTTNSYAQFLQPIEGFNISDLGWGTANAQPVTFSFWARSSLTGQFGGSLSNSAANRSYPFSYTINAANTFEYKTITVAGDTTGTWLTNNGVGIYVNFNLGAGSSQLGTAGTWAAAALYGATGDTQVLSTTGATFYITGVQLERGSTASSFEYVDYGRQLIQCQRYYQTWAVTSRGYAGTATDYIAGASLCVQMRATPTVAIITNASSHSTVVGAYSVNNVYANSTVASNNQYLTQLIGSASAEL